MKYQYRRIAQLIVLAALSPPLSLMAQTTHVVQVRDSFFEPSQLTIQQGDTVRWENAPGGAGHDVDTEEGLWTPPAVSNEWNFEFTFTEAGTVNYFCNPHRAVGMTGVVNVEAAQSAPEINPGMNDAWVNANAPMQGFFFSVFPDISFFFLSWFTFDSVPPASDTATFGASDQRWVTGGGLYSGNTVTVSVELTSGGIFNASDPLGTQQPGYGTITIEFISCNEALLTYDFPSLGLSGQMTLTRAVTDNVALCESLAAG